MKNWFGTVEDGWRNHETGERIEFREKGDKLEIWIVGEVNGKERSEKKSQSDDWKVAQNKALQLAKKWQDEQYFAKYE